VIILGVAATAPIFSNATLYQQLVGVAAVRLLASLLANLILGLRLAARAMEVPPIRLLLPASAALMTPLIILVLSRLAMRAIDHLGVLALLAVILVVTGGVQAASHFLLRSAGR
jgi:hypothetical protein